MGEHRVTAGSLASQMAYWIHPVPPGLDLARLTENARRCEPTTAALSLGPVQVHDAAGLGTDELVALALAADPAPCRVEVWLGKNALLVRHQHLADFGTSDPVRRAILDPASLGPLPRTNGWLDERRAILLAAAYAIGRRPHRIVSLMRALRSRAGAIKGSACEDAAEQPSHLPSPGTPVPTEQPADRCARVLVVARRRFAFTRRPSAMDIYPELVDRLVTRDPSALQGTHEMVVSLRGYAPWIKTRWGNYVGTLRVRPDDRAGDLRSRLVAAEPIVARAIGMLRGTRTVMPAGDSTPLVDAPAHLSSTWSQVAPPAAGDLGFCGSFSTPRRDAIAVNVTVIGSTLNVVGSGLLHGWTQDDLGQMISELFTGRGLTPLPLDG